MVIATHGAVVEASSAEKERMLEEVVKASAETSAKGESMEAAVVKEANVSTVKKEASDSTATVAVKEKADTTSAPSMVSINAYAYAYAQVKLQNKSAADIWTEFKQSPKHDKIVATSPDVFEMLPEFFSSRFK